MLLKRGKKKVVKGENKKKKFLTRIGGK